MAESHDLYRAHELLLEHKAELFTDLQQRWKDLFATRLEVLLYDLTSTYFLALSDCYLNSAKPVDQKTNQGNLEGFPDQPAQQTRLAMTEIGLVGVA